MKASEQLHSGHRERMMTKFLISPEAFADHEVLETLLFYAVPRIDTNPLAHRLIKMFGNLQGVFSATKTQLMSVEGVGEKVATYIMCIGQMVSRVSKESKTAVCLRNTYEVNLWLKEFFVGKNFETFVMLLLDEKYNLITSIEFTDKNRLMVSAELPEVVTAINIHKPKFAVFSHNHPSDRVDPSEVDDFTTKKLNVICELNDVNLLDHIIMTSSDYFSYRQTGKLDYIKEKVNLNKLFKSIE